MTQSLQFRREIQQTKNLNLFFPTDNIHRNDELAQYSHGEWRLIAGDIGISGAVA